MIEQVAVVGIDGSPASYTLTVPTVPSRRLRMVKSQGAAGTPRTDTANDLPDDAGGEQQAVITHLPVPPASPEATNSRVSRSRVAAMIDVRTRGVVRTLILLGTGAAPILAIPAHVFGIAPIHLTALWLIVPAACLSIALLVWRAKPHDRVVIGGFLAGLLAVAAYDAFRLLTVYGLHWWGDFIPQMGGWITDGTSNALVGYVWRYPGDGGGIGLVFFALVACFGVTSWSRLRVMTVAIAFAVVPVWTGLIATVALAPTVRLCCSRSPRPRWH